MRLVQVQPPDTEPLTAEDARARLGIGSEIADEVLEAFITAARQGIDGVDGWLGRALITQTWQLMLPGFPHYWHRQHGAAVYLPLPPLQDVTEIRYIDGAGAAATMANGDFQIFQGSRPFIAPAYGKSWPATRDGPDAVTIEFIAGYGDDASDVPEPIRSAIALEVSRLRSMSARDQNIMVDNVVGVGSKTYATGRDAGADILSTASQALLSTYRILA